MEDKIPKRNKSKFQELVNPIIPLKRLEKEDIKPSKYIDHMCHNTPGYGTSGKYVIKIHRFDSGTPEEWFIFVNVVQKAIVEHNCMEWVLKGNAKAEFTQQSNLVGSCTVGNFTTLVTQ